MKKKILVVGPSMQLGGVERSLIGLLDAFDYDKVDVDLFLYAYGGELMSSINENVRLLPEIKLFVDFFKSKDKLLEEKRYFSLLLKVVSKIIQKIHKKRGCGEDSKDTFLKITANLIKFNSEKYDAALGFIDPFFFIEKKVNAKVKIGWAHTDWNTLCKRGSYIPAPGVWKSLDYVACVSEDIKTSFDELYPQYSEKSVVVENILPAEYVKKLADQFTVKEEMPDSVFKILSVGRFSPQKNYLETIRAAKILHDEGYLFKLYFVGYGTQEEKMRNLIAELGAEDYVIILGKKENPYPYMKACDLYIQPSKYEGKAVTVREAQTLARPVMITRFPSSGSQLTDGLDGYICEQGVEGIAEGMKYMMNHPELRKKLSDNCAVGDFSGQSEMSKIMNLL